MVVYNADATPIAVSGALHSSRDVQKILGDAT
jgi:hypothetical protein